MKTLFTLGLLFCIFTVGTAQPANDDCATAITLSLNMPSPCPSTTPVTNTFNSYNNIDATPASPYPALTGCSVGGSLDAPAAEVWFNFIARGNVTTITISGLSTPNIAVATGTNCAFLSWLDCASANTGAGQVTLTVNTLVGTNYYLMVSGGNLNDQGNFNMTISSSNNCNPCLLGNTFLASPPPQNGTYSSGQTVNFCFTINQWDVTSTIEWFHAITIDLGPGWNPNVIPTVIPPACGNDGSWGFYTSWTGCNTGQTFGPGFAYDSSSGIGCGGSANDGNPGNNWGDGTGGCANIGTPNNPSVTFCWAVTVANCPPNSNGNDLSMSVSVWSDGDSGSWTQTGCNSGTTFNLLASAVCCTDSNPLVLPSPTSCPGAGNGSLQIQPSGGAAPPGELYNIVVFDAMNNIVFTCNGCSGIIIADNLPAGNYSIVATNVLSGCVRSINRAIPAGTPPEAIANTIGMPCPGDPITLSGDVNPADPSATYYWTGPGGYTSTQQNPTDATQAGTYTLVVTSAGCQSPPAMIDVQFVNLIVSATANPQTACAGGQVILTGNGAQTYTWENTTTGTVLGSGNPFVTTINEPTIFTVTGTDANGCTETGEVIVDVNPSPDIDINVTGNLCANQPIVLQATGAQTYQWSDGVSTNPRIVSHPQGSYSYQVTGTNANGCSATESITLNITNPPNGNITPSNPIICAGQSVTLAASGGNNYSWSTNQSTASISVSPSVTTTYTVTVTNADGCESIVQTTVNVDQPVAAPAASCANITPNSVEFTWAAVPGATGYNVVVTSGQTGTLNGTNYTVDNLAPGESVTIEVTAQSGNSCPSASTTITCSAQNCPPVDVSISPVSDICLSAGAPALDLDVTITGGSGGTTVWSGNGITDAQQGIFDPNAAGVGAHQITATYTEGPCPYSDVVTINVFAIPTADFSAAPSPVCTGDDVTINYTGSAASGATYTWDFGGGAANPGTGPGPHTVSWTTAGDKTITLTVEENGCTSPAFSQTVSVQAPLEEPVISCGNASTTSVTFNWNDVAGATGYVVNVLSGQTGTQSGNSFTVDNLAPGETVTIEVIAQNGGPCGDSSAQLTCNAEDCPVFDISIDPVADICLDGTDPSFNLTATVTGGQGNGTRVWSGPGITDPANGAFDPATAGAGTHTITLTYTEGPCQVSATTTIDVFDTPTADFTVDPADVCINQEVTVTYTGTADVANTTFTWGFSGGVVSSGSGAGPYMVSWATGGSRTITLTVVENGCTSTQFSQTVQVSNPLPNPVINCITSTSSITFSWNDVPNATSYNITVLTGQTGVQSGNSFTVDGLTPGETVTIQVEAVGTGPCGNSSAQQSCVAEDCPVVNIDISPISDICLDAGASAITLTATLSGGSGGGTQTWSGPGITNPSTGAFDPDTAGPGQHTINFNYQEGNCTYNASTTITVNEQPTADFTAASPVCVDQTSNIAYTGSASPGADYAWDFDGGNVISGSGSGPYEISWPTGGSKTISLVVTENGCPSEPFSLNIQVDEPLPDPQITCETTNTSITFSWDDVPGATGYQVVVISGASGIQTGNSYTVSGLNPGDATTIQVVAQTNSPCGPSMSEATCIAQDCPNVTIDITPAGPFCADDNPATLSATANGGAGGGQFAWSGPGITDPSGIFDPSSVAPGDHTLTVVYTEGVCTYTATTTVAVNPVPTAEFTLSADPVCVDEPVTVTFTGTASPNAVFTWNFGGGVADPGTGPGPHTVSWNSAGNKAVNLTINDNGCTAAGEGFTLTIDVDAPLATPIINCISTSSTSVTFGWNPVPGATGYEVTVLNGPDGVLSGETYTIDGLTPQQEVTIQVSALGDGPCGNSVGEGSCIAQDCPPLTISLSGTDVVCEGGAADITFDFSGTSAGPFIVAYTVNAGSQQTVTLSDGGSISLDNLTALTVIQVISVTDSSLPDCTYPGNVTWAVQVSQTVEAGVALPPARFCQGETQQIVLFNLLSGADPGGQWTETSISPSTGNAFNAAGGTFTTTNQAPGTYTFRYRIDAADPCPDDEATVSVTIEPTPQADAGQDQELTCNMGMVSLGSAPVPGLTYEWTSDNPNAVIANPSNAIIEVSHPGRYTLTVTNDIGCSSSDEALVTANLEVPTANVSVSGITCFQADDGVITIENTSGGTPPYQYSINGGPLTGQTQFISLGPNSYVLRIQDANGCFSELTVDLTEPDELIVTLSTNLAGSDRVVELGDSVRLEAVFNPGVQLDTIIWSPAGIANGNANAVWVSPITQTTYSVTIVDVNGCRDSDNLTLFVQRTRPVFIPNVFSPNEDGYNDIFYIQGGSQVKEIKTFLIFNRWGETLMELRSFQPNDPDYGWDGKYRGQFMNPGVFAYFAEIEFDDGEVILYKGDVTLLK